MGFRSWQGQRVVPPLYACIVTESSTIAGLPLIAARDGRPHERMPETVLDMLLQRPSDSIPKTRFWRHVFMEVVGRGMSVVWIRRVAGVPVELVPARRVGKRNAGALQLSAGVQIQIPGRDGAVLMDDVPPRDLLLFYDETWDPFRGLGFDPLSSKTLNAIELWDSLIKMYGQLLANGGHSKVYVTLPDSSQDRQKLKDDWAEWAGGVDKAGLPFLIGYGGDVKTVSHSAEQQQIVEMMRMVSLMICQTMQMDPRRVFVDEPGNGARARSTLMEAHTAWLDHGLRARLAGIADEITLKLADGEERAVFDTSHLSMGTLRDKAMVADMLTAKAPILTPNESRRDIMEYPALPEPMYDEIWPTKGAPPKAAAGKPAADSVG